MIEAHVLPPVDIHGYILFNIIATSKIGPNDSHLWSCVFYYQFLALYDKRSLSNHIFGWLKNHVMVKPFEMNVLFLTTLSNLKACNSPYMQYYFKQSFVLHSSEVIFSFLIKTSRQKAIEIEIAFFHCLGNPKGRTLDHFFYASHIRHNFPYKLIPISMS